MSPSAGTRPEEALSEAWLARTDAVFDFYKPLHDRYASGTPIWITETADSACGGNPWAATFLDSFRYLDQLGRLAQRGVAVIFHNTLTSSEYRTTRPAGLYATSELLGRAALATADGVRRARCGPFDPVCTFMRIACAAGRAASPYWRSTTVPANTA